MEKDCTNSEPIEITLRKQMSPDFSIHAIPGIYTALLVKSCGRSIGHIDYKDISGFIDGDYSLFRPISNWQNTFSMGLKKELHLI